jgi:hypothetical protein
MKKIILSLVVITILTGITYPQKMRDKILKNKNKLEQLEKVKLIEALDLNEESSLRFFARRGDFKKEMEKLEERNDEVILELENTFNSDDKNIENKQSLLLNEFLKNKQEVEIKRQEFLSSLNDILSKEQICKYVVFEKKFRDEIRSIIMDNKKHKKN